MWSYWQGNCYFNFRISFEGTQFITLVGLHQCKVKLAVDPAVWEAWDINLGQSALLGL